MSFEGVNEAKRKALQSAAEYRKTVQGQALLIGHRLTRLGLTNDEVIVDDRTVIRDARYYQDRPTFARDQADESEIVALVSGAAKADIVSTLLIVPTNHTSGLLVGENGQLFADSFWEGEQGKDGKPVLRHIKPSQPIPVDGHDINFRKVREKINKFESAVFGIAGDKAYCKTILNKAGIAVAPGIFIPVKDQDKALEKSEEFIAGFEAGTEFVFKPVSESCGEGVILGDPRSSTFQEQMVERNEKTDEERGFLLEKRILPPPQPELAMKLNLAAEEEENPVLVTADQVDYNFRVLLSLSSSPKVIDAEVRYKSRSEDPVNVSQGASAATVDVLKDPAMVKKAYKQARRAIKALYTEAAKITSSDQKTSDQYIGVDVIFDQDGEPYIMEVQAGPGGFGTLTKLRGKPADSVSDILVPEQARHLKQKATERKPFEPEKTTRIRPSKNDEFVRYAASYRGEDYRKAQEHYMRYIKQFPKGAVENLEALDDLVEETGDYAEAYLYASKLYYRTKDTSEYDNRFEVYKDKFKAGLQEQREYEAKLREANELLSDDPEDYYALTDKAIALSRLKRAEEALEATTTCVALYPDDPHANNNRAASLINLGREEEALEEYNKALQKEYDTRSEYITSIRGKIKMLEVLERYEEADILIEQYKELVSELR